MTTDSVVTIKLAPRRSLLRMFTSSRGGRAVAATALLCAFSAPLAPGMMREAAGSNWSGASGVGGGCDSITSDLNNRADNRSHDLYYHELTTTMQTATNWTIGNNINKTIMNAFEVDALNAYTDVLVFDGRDLEVCGRKFFPQTGTVGMTICASVNSNGRCGQQRVYYSNDWTHASGTTETNRRWLTCHEQGHAVGLQHRFDSSSSCLRRGPSALTLSYWDNHDKGHINANY